MISSARHTRLAAALASAAVAAALAPTASANHGPNVPRPHDGIYVNPSTGFATSVSPARAEARIYVNPSTGFASKTVEKPQRGGSSELAPGYTRRYVGSSLSVVPKRAVTRSATSQPVPTDQPGPAGFDWPSAGIGAAAISGLLLLILGATFGISKRRHHRVALRG